MIGGFPDSIGGQVHRSCFEIGLVIFAEETAWQARLVVLVNLVVHLELNTRDNHMSISTAFGQDRPQITFCTSKTTDSNHIVAGSILLLLALPSTCIGAFGLLVVLAGLLKQRLSAVSRKDSLSSKDNLIETRTKIIVGAMP